ncbi:unnamed protein product [Gordionus sp. m RMFG-2023]|uniref:FH1/FH2 domain-containing protein 3-like n=1 Tax=Gordionus sp. m RMFG-2023 TaxID=3053472 RepID=UPI0030DFEF85
MVNLKDEKMNSNNRIDSDKFENRTSRYANHSKHGSIIPNGNKNSLENRNGKNANDYIHRGGKARVKDEGNQLFTCRVQFLDDLDPFNSSPSGYTTIMTPEPLRPLMYSFFLQIPLNNQIPSLHKFLKAPHKIKDCALQLYKLNNHTNNLNGKDMNSNYPQNKSEILYNNLKRQFLSEDSDRFDEPKGVNSNASGELGHYLDLDSTLDEQIEDLQCLEDESGSLVLRTSITVRVHHIVEKLLNSTGRQLRRGLFSLKQLFQDDKDLVHEFILNDGLSCLIKIGMEGDQNHQNYILRAISQIMLYVDGMDGIKTHNETLQWLYSLLSSKFRLVIKTALKLILVFLEYREENSYPFLNSVYKVQPDQPLKLMIELLDDKELLNDSEILIHSITIINRVLTQLSPKKLEKYRNFGAKIPVTYNELIKSVERSNLNQIVKRYLNRVAQSGNYNNGFDNDFIEQLNRYITLSKLSDLSSLADQRFCEGKQTTNHNNLNGNVKRDNTSEYKKRFSECNISTPDMVDNRSPVNHSTIKYNGHDNSVYQNSGNAFNTNYTDNMTLSSSSTSSYNSCNSFANRNKALTGSLNSNDITTWPKKHYISNSMNSSQDSQDNLYDTTGVNKDNNSNTNKMLFSWRDKFKRSDLITDKKIEEIPENGLLSNSKNNPSTICTQSNCLTQGSNNKTSLFSNGYATLNEDYYDDCYLKQIPTAKPSSGPTPSSARSKFQYLESINNSCKTKNIKNSVSPIGNGHENKRLYVYQNSRSDVKNSSSITNNLLSKNNPDFCRKDDNSNKAVCKKSQMLDNIYRNSNTREQYVQSVPEASPATAKLNEPKFTNGSAVTRTPNIGNNNNNNKFVYPSKDGVKNTCHSNNIGNNQSYNDRIMTDDKFKNESNTVSYGYSPNRSNFKEQSIQSHPGVNYQPPKITVNSMNGSVSLHDNMINLPSKMVPSFLSSNVGDTPSFNIARTSADNVDNFAKSPGGYNLGSNHKSANDNCGQFRSNIESIITTNALAPDGEDSQKYKSESQMEWERLLKNLKRPLQISDLDFSDLTPEDDIDIYYNDQKNNVANTNNLNGVGSNSIRQAPPTLLVTAPPPPPLPFNLNLKNDGAFDRNNTPPAVPPPPPPLMKNPLSKTLSSSTMCLSSTDKSSHNQNIRKTLRLFWKELKIPDNHRTTSNNYQYNSPLKSDQSIWTSLRPVKLDFDKLEYLFETRAKEPLPKNKSDNKRGQIIVLDSKRSNAINIGMTKLPPARAIKAAVLKMDNSIMNRDGIEKLLSIMIPTEEEKQKILDAQMAHPELPLGTAEQFLLTLSSISELKARLKLWAFKSDYEGMERDIAEPLMDLKNGLKEVEENKTLNYVLSVILSIGNFLNGTQCKGFHIDYLSKIPEIKDTVQKQNLLHHVCDHVMDRYPDSTDMYSEMGNLVRSSRVDFDDLTNNLEKTEHLCKESWDNLRAVIKYETGPVLKIRMSEFINDCAQRIMVLKIVHRRLNNRYKRTLRYFGITGNSVDSLKITIFCRIFTDFALEYKTAREKLVENVKKKQKHKERNMTRGKMIIDSIKRSIPSSLLDKNNNKTHNDNDRAYAKNNQSANVNNNNISKSKFSLKNFITNTKPDSDIHKATNGQLYNYQQNLSADRALQNILLSPNSKFNGLTSTSSIPSRSMQGPSRSGTNNSCQGNASRKSEPFYQRQNVTNGSRLGSKAGSNNKLNNNGEELYTDDEILESLISSSSNFTNSRANPARRSLNTHARIR